MAAYAKTKKGGMSNNDSPPQKSKTLKTNIKSAQPVNIVIYNSFYYFNITLSTEQVL